MKARCFIIWLVATLFGRDTAARFVNSRGWNGNRESGALERSASKRGESLAMLMFVVTVLAALGAWL